MLGERWSDTVIHLAWLCLFPMDMGSDTFPAGNYMLSSHCALCNALWEALKSPETRLREPSWGESSEGRLFHRNPGIALQVLLWVIHRVFFKVLKRCNLRKKSKEQNLFEFKITELLRLENTSEIESNLWLTTTLTARPWHWVPNPVISWTQNDPIVAAWAPYFTGHDANPDVDLDSKQVQAVPELNLGSRCLSSHPKLCSDLHSPLQISQWEKTEWGGEWLAKRRSRRRGARKVKHFQWDLPFSHTLPWIPDNSSGWQCPYPL